MIVLVVLEVPVDAVLFAETRNEGEIGLPVLCHVFESLEAVIDLDLDVTTEAVVLEDFPQDVRHRLLFEDSALPCPAEEP